MAEFQDYKPLPQVLLPDPRSVGKELADCHARIESISLVSMVPASVRHVFDRARNLSLYSWFVYDFHVISDLVAFSALEMALRFKAERSYGRQLNLREKNLGYLLKDAVQNNWISNSGFERVRHVARARVAERKVLQSIIANPDRESWELPDPTDEDVMEEIGTMAYVDHIAKSIPVHRNELAHGSSAIYSGSVGTLEMVAEIINQLFPVID